MSDKTTLSIIDVHVHCWNLFGPSFEEYFEHLKYTDIKGAVIFSSVENIYPRDDPLFRDNKEWQARRRAANQYVLSLVNKKKGFKVFPFFFVWNDFALEQLPPYFGIKWHRHWNEPRYQYDSEGCKKFIETIQKRNMPVILEEELGNTLLFVNELAPNIRVIIPHCGLLNGGYDKLGAKGIWENPNVYTDTALASSGVVRDYIERYGHQRIMFGSDFPFGRPRMELEKILSLNIDEEIKKAITGTNILRLLGKVKKSD